MIPSAIVATLLGLAASAPTSTVAVSGLAPESAELDRFRMPWEYIIDKTIGTASKPVRFDWRKSDFQVGGFVAQPAEFNNYNALRTGVVTRFPTKDLMYELGLTYVFVWDTESSRQLALTPYRQPGRPQRFEIDFSIGLPLAEGVVTAWPSFFPASELVFSAYFNLRYLIYPGGFNGIKFRNILAASLSPKLTDDEIANLDDNRLEAMEVDTQRYGLYAGLGTDLYFDFGLFVSPRVLISVPLLAVISESKLQLSLEFSLAIGAAF